MPIKPFIPKKLPRKINYENLISSIAEGHRAIASLDTSLTHLPNPKILGRTLQTKEAVLSSKIEGTQASIKEVFEYEAQMGEKEDTERKKDIREIITYRNALNYGVQHLNNKNVSQKFFKKLHSILLKTERGKKKSPGEFRKTQVYIGRIGASIEEASFVPPPANKIVPLMKNLEVYINSDKEKDPLVQMAIAHYQFEAIHPFLDGNGRVGRLLISLFLYKKGLLTHPFLYLSEFFEENRQDYYALLSGVSELGDIESWIKFFLYALKTQALKAEKASSDILKLYAKTKEKVMEINSAYAFNLLDAIFIHPVFSSRSIREDAKIKNTQTFFSMIDKFEKKEIIKKTSPKKKRNKIYVFEDLVKIVNR